MKFKLIKLNQGILILCILFSFTITAQYSSSPGTIRNSFSVNGFGGTKNSALLLKSETSLKDWGIRNTGGDHFGVQMYTTSGWKNFLNINKTGNVGIGNIENPYYSLHIHNDKDQNSYKNNTRIQLTSSLTGTSSKDGFIIGLHTINVDGSKKQEAILLNREATPLTLWTSSKRRVDVEADGNVHVHETLTVGTEKVVDGAVAHIDGRIYVSEEDGTEEGFDNKDHENYKDYLLWVEEGIVGNDVAVSDAEHFPDYVFDADYELPSLEEIEQFIKENGHLHTMEPAELLAKKGFTVTDMTIRTVTTIEELTLHTIAQEKKITGLEEKLDKQALLIQQLTDRLEKLALQNK